MLMPDHVTTDTTGIICKAFCSLRQCYVNDTIIEKMLGVGKGHSNITAKSNNVSSIRHIIYNIQNLRW
jgi:hypothetical protein